MSSPGNVRCDMRAEPLSSDGTAVAAVAKLSGAFPEGSMGNEDAERCSAIVAEFVRKLTESGRRAGLAIDCLELDYRWGDYLGSIWVSHWANDIPCAIVAGGETREAIEGLLRLGTPINVSGSLSEGMEHLRRALASEIEE